MTPESQDGSRDELHDEGKDDFYVGYLPLAPAFRRFVRLFVPTLVVAVVVLVAVLALRQPKPVAGTWDLAEPVTVSGTFREQPYPMIVLAADDDQVERTVLLVTMGKMGAGGDTDLTDGQTVSVTGFPIGTAEGTVLLAIESPDVDLTAAGSGVEDSSAGSETSITVGSTTLMGEIIDPKCYFGAMKPGEGKVHKACATLCIRGGIPPMLMTIDEAGERTFYLLLNASGDGIVGEELETLLPYVADPVAIEGTVEQRGGMLVLRADPAAIQRL